jgi:hypothetical protein
MSVDCRLFVGLTLELDRNLDFKKVEAFSIKYLELDEYEYASDDKEGRLLLIGDGMNGEFLRLIQVDKFIDGGSLGYDNEFIELPAPPTCFNKELIEKMADIYEDYTDTRPALSDFKYALWSQWY